MNWNILIAEDEPKLLEVLCDYFLSRGDLPTPAADGVQALAAAQAGMFDAVLLNIMMPGLDGFAVCRAIRAKSDVPILFLTALSDEEDKLYGYELGADDYVTKPYSLSVLYAKAAALIRRSRGDMAEGKLSAGALSIDTAARRAFLGGQELSLTPKEFALLECLLRHKGSVLSREQLIAQCWGWDYEGDARAVDTHIRRLRDKLGSCGACIKTVIKAGYRLEVV